DEDRARGDRVARPAAPHAPGERARHAPLDRARARPRGRGRGGGRLMARMTREERRAHTRSCLMAAAGRIFSSQGLQQASIDDVAEEAGFTKGAFYANFRSKEELFLAMLDERFAARLEQIERVLATEHGLEDQTRRAGADFVAAMRADPEWERLFFEFAAYAARNPDFREELVTRYRSLREAIATALGRAKEHHGGEAAMDLGQVSLM